MKRKIGIDLGDARTGIAVSDELGMLAHPRATLKESSSKKLVAAIAALVKELDADTVVLGLPRNMDGTEGTRAEKSRAFSRDLSAHGALAGVKVVLWDERMTTLAAQKALHQAGRNTKNSREVVDQVAAQILLQSWLDSTAPMI